MFDVYCARHGSRVLLTESAIFGLADTETGPVLAWKCRCGQVGLLGRFADDGATVTEVQPLVPAA